MPIYSAEVNETGIGLGENNPKEYFNIGKGMQMNTTKLLLTLFLVVIATSFCTGQTYRVDLPQISSIDDPGLHVEVFTRVPKHPLVLPLVDTTNAWFLEEFYSWDVKGYPEIAVMVIPTDLGELLYIDRNDNRDLTDDGRPAFFPWTHNDFTFSIKSPTDPDQRVLLRFQRTPDLPDSMKAWYVDSAGNLLSKGAKFWGSVIGDLSYEGKRGTFYFDTPLGVRRGILQIGQEEYEVGLQDYTNDGLFNGKEEVLLVDLNQDGKLMSRTESFALSDVIVLDSLKLKVDRVDPYGRWVQFALTGQPATPFLVSLSERRVQRGTAGTIDPNVWKTKVRTLDGRVEDLTKFKGKYVLLNFWGEWCGPCVAEIPALVKAERTYRARGLRIVSFLKYGDLKRAEAVAKKAGLDWPQLVLSDSLAKKLRIRGYPTNILILPGGKRCVRAGQVTQLFFEMNIEGDRPLTTQ